ncbi:MAG: hypothetical protein M5U12_21700 [Verrucomicrobia bacterium]|nr:hypothetical protein [Verrucomicrobiota bacterium]
MIAPVAAFHLASHFSLTAIGLFCAGLIALASVLLLPEIRLFQSARRGQPVVDSVAE